MNSVCFAPFLSVRQYFSTHLQGLKTSSINFWEYDVGCPQFWWNLKATKVSDPSTVRVWSGVCSTYSMHLDCDSRTDRRSMKLQRTFLLPITSTESNVSKASFILASILVFTIPLLETTLSPVTDSSFLALHEALNTVDINFMKCYKNWAI